MTPLYRALPTPRFTAPRPAQPTSARTPQALLRRGQGWALASWASVLTLALAPAAQAMTEPELAARLASRIEGDRSDLCLQAAVIEPGQVLRGAACANPRTGRAPADDAAFEIGSVSKTMVAFLVADLVRSGRWQLGDPIALHLPANAEVPRQGERQITVADLLTHSASLPRLPPGFAPANRADPYADTTEASLLAALARTSLTGPIGSASSYSNFGMMVLSLAVARAQGDDLELALRQRLFEPLGMRGAHIQARPGAQAQGHSGTGKPVPPWTAATNLAGVGMVRATLDDMVRYAQGHLGLAPLGLAPAGLDQAARAAPGPAQTPPSQLASQAPSPPSSQQQAQDTATPDQPDTASNPALQAALANLAMTRQPLAHGLGMNWFLGTVAGRAVVNHAGATGGFNSFMVIDPAAQRAVVLLVDTDLAGPLDDLAFSLLGLGVPLRQARQPRPIPPELATAVEGEYQLGRLRLRVWRDGGVLLAQANGQPAIRLLYDSRGDFYTTAVSATATPLTDAAAVADAPAPDAAASTAPAAAADVPASAPTSAAPSASPAPTAKAQAPVVGFLWMQGGGVTEAWRVGYTPPLTASNPAWRDWAGEYAVAPGFSLRVFQRGQHLMLQGTGQPAAAVDVTGPDRIEVKRVGAVLLFQRDAQGQVDSATLLQNGASLNGPKLPAAAPAGAPPSKPGSTIKPPSNDPSSPKAEP